MLPLARSASYSIVDALHFIHGLLFGRVVGGADLRRAFEGHVLEHVGDAGFAAGIVHGAGVHEGMEGDHGRVMPLEHDKVQAVGERELGDALFEIGERLRGAGGGGQDGDQEEYGIETSTLILGHEGTPNARK